MELCNACPAAVQVPAGAQHAEQDSVAQRAAEALTAKGFPAQLRSSDVGLQQDAAALAQRKQEELQGRWVGWQAWLHF